MFPEQIVWITIFFSIIGYYFFFKDFFFGETRPNIVSWFLWMLPPFLATYFQLKAGAGFSVLPVFLAGFGPLLVCVVSLIKKNGYWKINFFDIICGFFSLVSLLVYFFTRNLAISILFAILSDGLAGIPTIVKAWKFPHTETSITYFSGIFNNIIGLLIIKDWSFSIYSMGIYFILMNSSIVLAIYHKQIKNKLNFL